MLFKI